MNNWIKKWLKNCLLAGFFVCAIFAWTKSASAATGELIITIRINDLHGWVYTYDSGIAPSTFGLMASGTTITDSYFPANGVIKKTVQDGPLTIELKCSGVCANKLDFSEPENVFVRDVVNIQAGKTNYVNFVVKPLDQEAVLSLNSVSVSTGGRSGLITFSGRMLQKSQKMLNWVLNINDAGFYNQAINNIYKKVVSVINGFLIIALLIIAAAWNFAAIISTKTLRQMLFLFAFVSILVNFTLPIGRLGVDLAETVQASFLTKSDGTKITADDLLAVNLNDDWLGEIQNSWTRLERPMRTKWEISGGPDFYTDFTKQNELAVDVTAKGEGPDSYLEQEDCTTENRGKCVHDENGYIDCTEVHLMQNCRIGREYKIALCGEGSPVNNWIFLTYRCVEN